MSAIYESDHARIYCGDATEQLAHVTTGEVDLLATDPPYGVDYQSGFRKKENRHARIAGDQVEGAEAVAEILSRAGKKCGKSGHVYVFGIGPEVIRLSMPRLSAVSELIWDKQLTTMGDLDSPWMTNFEKITFGYHASDMAQVRRGYGSLSARKRQSAVLRVPRRNSGQTNRHPTEKPVALMSQLIESSTVVGNTVLDPFMGSGSTAVAAILLGRKAIGIELDETYAAAAVERVKAAEKLRRQVLAA